MLTQEMKTELVAGLLSIFQDDILQIILYGSVARNEAAEDSDIDIAIILKTALPADKRERFITWSADLDMKYDKVFSIVDIEKSHLEQWGNVLPFYQNIQKEGISLWKAA